jgi:hypothetical protein
MIRSNRGLRAVILPLAFAAAMGSPSLVRGDLERIIVPSYFYPGSGGPGGVGDGWAAMTAAASQVPITAIVNPSNGPGPGEDLNYANAMTNLENAGGHVVAYVFTNDGTAPLATVEAQINTYISQYGKLINGFFLDGMSILPSTLSYYQTLNSYITGLNPSYTIIGNPGQPFLNGVAPSDYLSVANTFNIFEGDNTAFSSYPNGNSWFQSYPSSDFSNVIYNVPTVSAMMADLTRAIQLNAGSVFITDQDGGNPYAQLPSYWDQEVAAVAAASVPEPGTLPVAVSGAVVASLVAAARKRRRKFGR